MTDDYKSQLRRLDNAPVEECQVVRLELMRHVEAIGDLVERKLLKECDVKLGRVYRIGAGRKYVGRKILAMSLRVVSGWTVEEPDRLVLFVEGPLNNKHSTAGDGFNCRWQNIEPRFLIIGNAERYTGKRKIHYGR